MGYVCGGEKTREKKKKRKEKEKEKKRMDARKGKKGIIIKK